MNSIQNQNNSKATLLTQVFLFFTKKDLYTNKSISFKEKLINTSKITIFSILVVQGVSILTVFFLKNYLNFNPYDYNKALESINNITVLSLFFQVVVFAPLWEELSFRLFLGYKPISFLAGYTLHFLTIILILGGIFFKYFKLQTSYLLILSVISTMVVFIIYQKLDPEKYKLFFFKNRLKIIWYGSLIFGLFHLINYSNLDIIGFWAFLLVLPQIMISFFLSWSRVVYGYFWAVFMHSLYNLLLILPIMFITFLKKTDRVGDIREYSFKSYNLLFEANLNSFFLYFLIFLMFVSVLAVFFLSASLLFGFVKDILIMKKEKNN